MCLKCNQKLHFVHAIQLHAYSCTRASSNVAWTVKLRMTSPKRSNLLHNLEKASCIFKIAEIPTPVDYFCAGMPLILLYQTWGNLYTVITWLWYAGIGTIVRMNTGCVSSDTRVQTNDWQEVNTAIIVLSIDTFGNEISSQFYIMDNLSSVHTQLSVPL